MKPESKVMRFRESNYFIFADLGEGVRDVRGYASMSEWLFLREMPGRCRCDEDGTAAATLAQPIF